LHRYTEEILREYRELNDAEDVECAAPWTQCGGTVGHLHKLNAV
jgi:hypothetical protein